MEGEELESQRVASINSAWQLLMVFFFDSNKSQLMKQLQKHNLAHRIVSLTSRLMLPKSHEVDPRLVDLATHAEMLHKLAADLK